jgi:hypothetical protein
MAAVVEFSSKPPPPKPGRLTCPDEVRALPRNDN